MKRATSTRATRHEAKAGGASCHQLPCSLRISESQQRQQPCSSAPTFLLWQLIPERRLATSVPSIGSSQCSGSSAMPLLASGSGDGRSSGRGYREGAAARPSAAAAGARGTQRRCGFLDDPYSAGHQGRRSEGAWSQALRGHPGTRRPKGLPSCSTTAHSPPRRVPRSAALRSRPFWPCRRCLRLRRPSPKAPTSRLRHPTRAKACRSRLTARPVARGRCLVGPPASSA